jgi:hypothetical protein
MAAISDNGSFNLGLANIAASNYGPNATTSQANTAANTQNVQAETQGKQIQNASARLQYQLFAQAMQHMTDFSGQGGPSLGDGVDDASGVTPTSALPGAGAKGSGVTPEMDVGRSASEQALIEPQLESQYNVNPMGTPQEQQAIMQAHQYAVQMKLSGNKGLADSAEQRLAMLKEQRDMNVVDRKNAAQVDASKHYDKFDAVANAPEGQAFDTLEAVVGPESAKAIRQKHPDATPEELDEIARDTTKHVGAFIHRFTDRPVKVGDDGATYDEKSGMKVDVPIRGVTPEKQAALLEQANKIVTTKDSDGREETVPQYKRDGYSNPNAWVSDALARIRARNGASNVVEAARNRAARVPPQPVAPGQPGAPPQPGQQPGQPQPAAPGQQPGAPPPVAGAAAPPGGAPPPPPKDNGLLPGINPDEIPKAQTAPVRHGVGQTPAEAETAKGYATARLEKMKDANDAYIEAQKSSALITAAKREAATLAQNPRMVGPGSALAQGLSKLKTFAMGQPPDALVDLGSLDKILLQMGAQNVRGALSGQKITNQEFMKMLTEGNPNSEMPLATINKLLDYQGAQVDYDQRFNRTKTMALQRGADPMSVDSEIASKADRGDYVEGKVGVRPPTKPGSSTPTVTSQEQYDALPKGASYVDSNGKPHVKGGKK